MNINLLPKKQAPVNKCQLIICGYVFAIFVAFIGGGFYHDNTNTDNANIRVKSERTTVDKMGYFNALSLLTENPFVPSAKAVGINREKKIPILMYHYIKPLPKGDEIGIGLTVSPEQFAKQLQEIKNAGYTPITFKDIIRPLPEKPIILTFDDGYEDAYATAFPLLRGAGMHGVFYIISDYLEKPGYANGTQIEKMAKNGMEIGSHSRNHKDLAKMGESEQAEQLIASKSRLEELIGLSVISFCYPTGSYNDTTVKLAKQAGYTNATTTKSGITTGALFEDDSYRLKRVRVTETTNLGGLLRSL